jgi:hypothetical protein
LPVTLVLLLLASAPVNAVEDSAQVKRWFKAPPREYSTGPLWVWNDWLTEGQIRDTLRDMARQKVKQVWVHPRPGLMTPYLEADWFRLWKVALNEAERLDMNVWIYDENSYPSGFAGGFVPEAMPQSRGQGLYFFTTNQVPPCDTNLVKVYRLDAGAAEEITASARAGEAIAGTNFLVVTNSYCTNAAWHGNRCYVNLLSPGVTEKFLELTMEPYRREIGGQFGKRVPGVFTDEPNIRPSDGWPWSEVLPAEFEKRWDFDLMAHLPSLNQPIGDWRRIRYQYFQVLNDQFIERWSRPYHDYCERYGLQWTGHYWDHDWPKCVGVPDNMAMYAWHQTPAIDCLMNQYEERVGSQFGNARMVRELSSVANQLGLKRTLCETYGAGGWDLRFEDMKRIGDWLEVLGVNLINQHLSYVTIRGARKRDHPQSFSYHEPWWDAYHVSADYLGRLSAALSQGEQTNQVLVLEPTTTAWMYQGDDESLKKLGNAFFELVMTLESSQVEYDLGSEDILRRHGSASSAGLKVGRREYRTVVLPPFTENITSNTARLLEQFLALGGSVLSCGPAPSRIDGGVSPRGEAMTSLGNWTYASPEALPPMLPASGLAIQRREDDRGILFHHRRHLADGELLFLVNSSLRFPSVGLIESDLAGVEKWDLQTGQPEPYAFEKTPRGVQARFRLEPSGSLLVFISRKPLKPAVSSDPVVTYIRSEAPPVIRRLSKNVLPLDYVDVSAGGETRTNVYFYAANQFVWKKHGLDADPWDSAVQFRDELITRTFPAGTGFEASYRFTLEESVPADLEIVIERADLYTVTCNGKNVSTGGHDWWLDKDFARLPLARAARLGDNVVTIKAAPLSIFHELEPAYLLGAFRVEPVERGFVLRPEAPLGLGNASGGRGRRGWNTQGHPFYSGGVAYTERFLVDKLRGRFAVSLPAWYGSVAQVAVNGKTAGYIEAPPWECDVTKWIQAGPNTVEVTVIGTLKNTLGPHHGNPKLGAAWPKAFQTGPEFGPPPGTNYSTVAYGLFQPVVLKRSLTAND